MIRATPNCVKWEQVNRVNYRFQALNFQSDVLEALILSSPPLIRKDRTNSLSSAAGIREKKLLSPATSRKLGIGRSLSFDEAKRVCGYNKDDDSLLSRKSRKHIPVRKVGIAHQIVMQDPSTKEGPRLSNASLDTDGLRMKVDKLKESRIENKQCHSNESTDTRTHPCMSCNVRNEPPSDLGSKSKEELMELVCSLNNELKEARRPCSEIKKSESSTIGCTRLNPSLNHCSSKPELRTSSYSTEQDQLFDHSSNSSLITQMQLLEKEIQRAQIITTKFEEELSNLKTRMSRILSKSQSINDEYRILCEDVIKSEKIDNSSDSGIHLPTVSTSSENYSVLSSSVCAETNVNDR